MLSVKVESSNEYIKHSTGECGGIWMLCQCVVILCYFSQVLSINSCYGSCNQIALLHPLTPSTSSVSLVKEDRTKDVLQSIITEASPSMTSSTSESSLSYYPDDCQLLYSSRHQSCDQSCDHHSMSLSSEVHNAYIA